MTTIPIGTILGWPKGTPVPAGWRACRGHDVRCDADKIVIIKVGA